MKLGHDCAAPLSCTYMHIHIQQEFYMCLFTPPQTRSSENTPRCAGSNSELSTTRFQRAHMKVQESSPHIKQVRIHGMSTQGRELGTVIQQHSCPQGEIK